MKTKVALVFDDSFRRSREQIADIFSSYGLRGVSAVIKGRTEWRD